MNALTSVAPVLLLISSSACAEPLSLIAEEQKTLNVITDIMVIRPISLIGTLTGAALFTVFSPFTALAAIAPPHDAFARAADAFIGVPDCYAFNRPLGSAISGQAASNQGYCRW